MSHIALISKESIESLKKESNNQYKNTPLETEKKSLLNSLIISSKDQKIQFTLLKESLKNEYKKSTFYNRKIDYGNHFHTLYLSKRKTSIKTIHNLCEILGYDDKIYYNAVDYLDRIYLNNQKKYTFQIEKIDNIAVICLLLSIKYNGNHIKNKQNNNDKLIDLLKIINNYKELEIKCLITLEYQLGLFTAYDYIHAYFSCFFNYHEQIVDLNILNIYQKCIDLLSRIIYDDRYLDFNSFNLAISIMEMIFERNYGNFRILIHIKNTFEDLFGCNLNKNSFIKCDFILHCIMNYKKNTNKSNYNVKFIQINYGCFKNFSNNSSTISTNATNDSVDCN